ncbi:hypothetical protein HOD29_01840 [archaeon]|jgi:hypothetical protein|nr:hypothetical protein [archaeon]
MSTLTVIMKDIAASLYHCPATFEELLERNFLENYSSVGIDSLLGKMQKVSWIYEKEDRFYTFPEFAASKEMEGYDLIKDSVPPSL